MECCAFYRLQHSFHRRLSFCSRGQGVLQTPPGRHPLADTPWAEPPGQTPPGRHPTSRHSPSRHFPQQTPLADTPLPSACWDTPPPPPVATAADGTHPTGMHSCLWLNLGQLGTDPGNFTSRAFPETPVMGLLCDNEN